MPVLPGFQVVQSGPLHRLSLQTDRATDNDGGGGIGGQLGRISLGEQKVPCHQTEIKERGTLTETLFRKFQDR